MESEVVVTRTAKVWLGEDGIVRGVIVPDLDVSEGDARENVAAFGRVSRGKRSPILIDLRHIRKGLSREARVYYAGDEPAKVVSAVALLVHSPLSRMIGQFFLGLNKPPTPLRLFTSEDQAVEWLKGQMP